jgi:Fe-S-cluster containining protein
MGSGQATFVLDLLGRRYECSASLPLDPAPASRLLPVINAVADLVVDVHSSGANLSCRAGCGACCRQPVPITLAEARRIAALVESLPVDRREIVESRFAAAVKKLRETGMFDILTGAVNPGPDITRTLSYRYFDLAIACPFLEQESCSIYEDRPLRCREYLVTSHPDLCSDPEHQPVATVPIPNRPSDALASIGRGDQSLTPSFIPLTLALEWSALHPDPETRLPAADILRSFLTALASGPPPATAGSHD